MTYEVEVTIRGPESEPNDRGYTNRATLATFQVPADPDVAFLVYQDALRRLTQGHVSVEAPA